MLISILYILFLSLDQQWNLRMLRMLAIKSHFLLIEHLIIVYKLLKIGISSYKLSGLCISDLSINLHSIQSYRPIILNRTADKLDNAR